MHIKFQNYTPINDQLDNTEEPLVALQPKYPLNSVLYLVSEGKPSTPFNLLIQLNQNRWWGMNELWWLEKICFDVLTRRMKIKCIFNGAVSFMDTDKVAKVAKKSAYSSSSFHTDIFEIYTCKY